MAVVEGRPKSGLKVEFFKQVEWEKENTQSVFYSIQYCPELN